MNVLNLFRRNKAVSQTQTLEQLIDLLNLGGISSEKLSEATYFACMKILGESVGKLPLKLLRYDPKLGVEKAYDNPLYDIVGTRPNPYMTATNFWSTVEYNRNEYGNAYVWIKGAGSNQSLWILRPDVAANAKLWIAECRAKGLDVEVSNTVRDNEYQAYLYAQGRTRPGSIVTNAKTTTFHGAGLAIDFYSKSQGWSDHSFFVECAAIANKYGFSWAGDWKSFVEYCHIQWDNHRKSNHKNAPKMPLYEEEEDMTAEQTQAMIEKALKARQQPVWDKLEDVPAWGRATVERLMKRGAIEGNKDGNLELNFDQLRVLVINDKAGTYGR